MKNKSGVIVNEQSLIPQNPVDSISFEPNIEIAQIWIGSEQALTGLNYEILTYLGFSLVFPLAKFSQWRWMLVVLT